jgi:hypothetical protein
VLLEPQDFQVCLDLKVHPDLKDHKVPQDCRDQQVFRETQEQQGQQVNDEFNAVTVNAALILP